MIIDKTEAMEVVEAILADLSDRCGLQNEWENIDATIQEEIKDEWADIVRKTLKRKT